MRGDFSAINAKIAEQILHAHRRMAFPKKSNSRRLLFGVSRVFRFTVDYTLGTKLRLKIKPSPDEKVIMMDVKKRSKKFGFLKPMIVIKSDALIGNVMIVLMPHSKIFDPLTDSEHGKFLFYCRDYASSFHTIILAGKEKIFSISQNNSRNRHGFARFRRKPLADSRSLEMIDIIMRIFDANKILKFDWAIFG